MPTLLSKSKLASISLLAFSFMMLLTPFLPIGYSSNLPNGYQPNQACVTTTTTSTTSTSSLTQETSTVTGTGPPQTITTTTATDAFFPLTTSTVCTVDGGTATATVLIIQVFLMDLLIFIQTIIPEYPFGIAILAVLMVIVYGIIKRRTTRAT